MIFWMRNKLKQKRIKKAIAKGSKVMFGGGIDCTVPENIFISDYVYIGPECKLYGRGKVIIDENAIIGNHVCILTSNHNYENATMLPYDAYGEDKDVHICQNVWIASFVFILPGVTVGEGAVIAGGSIVTKNVPPLAIVGGNPARIIKYRDAEHYEMLKQQKKFYMVNKLKGR